MWGSSGNFLSTLPVLEKVPYVLIPCRNTTLFSSQTFAHFTDLGSDSSTDRSSECVLSLEPVPVECRVFTHLLLCLSQQLSIPNTPVSPGTSYISNVPSLLGWYC